tara:strand:- start:76 stop:855 length:780 start_codon:yes stop_codon:yes gene_type:complete
MTSLRSGVKMDLMKEFEIKKFIGGDFLPKKNKNITYKNLFSVYHAWGEDSFHGESSRTTVDLVTIKDTKMNFIIHSGWSDDYFSEIKLKLGTKINEKKLMNESFKIMNKCLRIIETEPVLPHILNLSGEVKWDLNKVFSIFDPKEYMPDDEDQMENNSFIFLTNGKRKISYENMSGDHISFAHSILYDLSVSEGSNSKDQSILGCPSVWNIRSISESIEEHEVDPTLREIIEKTFTEHYRYNYKNKKWEKSDIFSNKID